MIDLRPVTLVIGLLLMVLAAAMLLPAAADWLYRDHNWQVFVTSAAGTLFAGGALVLASRVGEFRFSLRQAFVLTTASWVALAAFAALPLYFSTLGLDYTDAFFEAISGLTTTGSTVIVGLDAAPPGILLWRALLQWLGGIGIVLTALTLLPMLRVGGMQMFRVEAIDFHERLVPRTTAIATALTLIYLGMTLTCGLALWLVGLDGFDAMVHALATLSTGGFSTSDQSMANFDNAAAEMIMALGMIAGGLPFVLFLQSVRGNARLLTRDSQVRAFLATLAVAAAVIALWLWTDGVPFGHALRLAIFNTTSVMTGSGFFSTDYAHWGFLPQVILFFLMFIGGCAGSTASGIKVFRFQILYANAKVQMPKLLQPHGIFIPYYNRRPIPDGVAEAVMGFFFLYALTFSLVSLLLGLMGLDFVTALSAAGAAITNAGTSLGGVGPGHTYAAMPAAAKWALSAAMLLGRLELFAVLVLLLPGFWRS